MLTNKPTPTTCTACNGEGRRECFSDEYSHRSGHYTREWTDECERCGGDGIEPEHVDCDCAACIAAWDAKEAA